MNRNLTAAVSAALASFVLSSVCPAQAHAGVTVWEDGDKKLEVGGRIQLQYHATDPDTGDSEDEIFFRRLRPYISGSMNRDWSAKLQFDIGKSTNDNELAVKDAYLRYKGFEGVTVTVGNQKPPFSREFLISSKEQQLVERTFVGDHNYGSPDRFAGVRVDGEAGGKVTWAGSFGSASVDPDVKKLDFDTPINRNDDFNEGWLTAGRVELHPFGIVDGSQGDLGGGDSFGLTLAVAAFTWSNDGDNDIYTDAGLATNSSKADVGEATGFELAAGVRGFGFSGDAQYQVIDGDTVAAGFTGGLFVDGATELEQIAVEAGYMVLPNRLELVGGWESQDADGYSETWNRTSLGVNYFLNGHKLKGQLTYRMGENLNGVTGNDADEVFLQLQYVF